MKIVLPVDGSEYTKRMLAYIATNDELLGPGHQYLFFTAVPPVPSHAAGFLRREALETYYREQAESVTRPVQRFADQHGWSSRVSHAAGHAADAIAAFVDLERPDLIVMGSHGHSALGARQHGPRIGKPWRACALQGTGAAGPLSGWPGIDLE